MVAPRRTTGNLSGTIQPGHAMKSPLLCLAALSGALMVHSDNAAAEDPMERFSPAGRTLTVYTTAASGQRLRDEDCRVRVHVFGQAHGLSAGRLREGIHPEQRCHA